MTVQSSSSLFGRVAAVLVVLSGCGTSATVRLNNGRTVQGAIVAGDQSAIYLDVGDDEGVTVPRRVIRDVDHPGNGAATVGVILLAYGVANIAVGLPQCDKNGATFCAGVFLPAGLGLALATYGLTVWGGSRKAMHTDHRGQQVKRLLLTPSYFYASGNGGPGLLLLSAF
jgi:hypothetical protein